MQVAGVEGPVPAGDTYLIIGVDVLFKARRLPQITKG